MSNENEKKICQNCEQEFTIESEDFEFYKKIDVPTPTFCHMCRMQRRMMFRNERNLYKRTCDLTGKNMVTIFAPDKDIKVFYYKDWWGDNWDQYESGMDYDFSRSFFEQFRELQMKAPWMNLIVDGDLVNSEYINHAGNCKDCYLIFNADDCENVLYTTTVFSTKDTADSFLVYQTELSYEAINSGGGSSMFYVEDCHGCHNIYFSKNCAFCSDCFGCVNLRNKQYHIFNKPYSREEYKKMMEHFNLHSYKAVQTILAKARDFWLEYPQKYYHGNKNQNVSGEYVYHSKNAHYMYQCSYAEDCKYCQILKMSKTTDCYDCTEWGYNLSLSYESVTVGDDTTGAKFCWGSWSGAQNTEYCMMVPGCEDCFGCCNLKKGKYCILNKQYSKEEYFKLREQIIKDMNNNPYIDKKGREYPYGEFFPYDISLYDYNESFVIDYFPMTEQDAKDAGFRWREPEEMPHEVTLKPQDIPDSIHDVDESILKEVLECVETGKKYRIAAAELQLLKRFGLPIPRKHPDVRHKDRLSCINRPGLYKRTTADGVEVMTPYAPDRPEKILSEKGYQDEVI